MKFAQHDLSILGCFLSVLILGSSIRCSHAAEALELQKGDHICLVGNALGERLQHYNQWEALLHQNFPEMELTVRNLCFPGDEPKTRIRSQDFGTPDDHLQHSGASVVLFFFGYNESFAGPEGLDKFKEELTETIQHTLKQDYGNGTPRVMLVSPIAFESTGDPDLPDAKDRNPNLILYRDAMRAVAQKTNVAFADLFDPSQQLFDNTNDRLTDNGCHLNRNGYQKFAPAMLKSMFPGATVNQPSEELVAVIDDKNFHWWHRYRAVNGFSIYGGRGKAGKDGSGQFNNNDVMERERAILDQMTANRDQKVWAIAKGKPDSYSIDDENTLPFLQPTTNVGLPNDPNAKRGKLGSLEYRTAEEQAKLFDLHPEFEIQLVASEEQFPEIANPVALNFDNKGRLYVATMPSYPHWKPKTKLDDKILLLEDTDGDGATDRVITHVGGLHQPTGFEFMGDGIIIAEQPDILYAEDTDGDDHAESVKRILFGFDSADSHHGIAAFEWGPGGNLYFQEGTFKFSQVETPNGLVRLGEAGVWQYHPKTKDVNVFSNFAFANPWGHVFDHWGQSFIGDASPGYGYWSAPITGRINYPLKHPGGSQHRRVAKLGGGDPKYQFPRFYPKRTRPLSGCAMISSSHFPESMQGNFLVTNVIGDRGVLNHEVREDGSGFVGKEVDPLLMCRDGNFRPVDIQIAPDGSLYIVDWHNALIGHLQHNLRDPSRDHSHGRIWRLKHKTRPLAKPVDVDGQPIAKLLDLLKSQEDRVRYRAKRELANRDSDQVVAALASWVSSLDASDANLQHHLTEALWMHQAHHRPNEDLLNRVLNSDDHRARSAAVRVLSCWIDEISNPLETLATTVRDDHPRVRLESVRALTFYPDLAQREQDILKIALAVLDSPMDDRIQYTLDEAMRRFEQDLGRSPKPILDSSDSITEYQLARLSADDLSRVPADPFKLEDAAVFAERLIRYETSRSMRKGAVETLSKLRKQSATEVLLGAIEAAENRDAKSPVLKTLTNDLIAQPVDELKKQSSKIAEKASSTSGFARTAALAGLMVAGDADKALELGNVDSASTIELFETTAVLPIDARKQLGDTINEVVTSDRPADVKQAAIKALGRMKLSPEELFNQLAPVASDAKLRDSIVQTLSKLPSKSYAPDAAKSLLDTLVGQLGKVPVAKRTDKSFNASLAFCRKLVSTLPKAESRSQRRRVNDLYVQLVRIGSVEEEMRYDVDFFAAEAGKPVQILLENHDLMPHNLVVCKPETLKEVANAGLQAGPKGGSTGLPYVPDSPNVLHATGLVDVRGRTRLTFTAPTEPGEYPYVCTFPQHWYRMYGVMVVVKDLAAWKKNPVKPKNPIGSTRSFIANWKVDNFKGKLGDKLASASMDRGKQLFAEASCLGCHKMKGEGGIVGPELSDVYAKYKGDDMKVLRSILHPSEEIDDKFAMQKILTVDGQTYTGILLSEDDESVKLLAGADAKSPTVIPADDIEIMQKSQISMMPKALLDQYTEEEVIDIMAYIKDGGK